MVQTDALYSEIERARKRLSRGLSDLLEATSSPDEFLYGDLYDLFETEISRTTNYIWAQQESQEKAAKAILTSIDTIVAHSGKEEASAKHREMAKSWSTYFGPSNVLSTRTKRPWKMLLSTGTRSFRLRAYLS